MLAAMFIACGSCSRTLPPPRVPAGPSFRKRQAHHCPCVFTGQDAASVVESSWPPLTIEYDAAVSQDINFSIFLPWVLVGSVGGGTVYATPREALETIGCAGTGRKWALAETIAAFALVTDVSTAASVASNTKSSGHQKLARANKL